MTRTLELARANEVAAMTDAQVYALKRGGMDALARTLGLDPTGFSSQVKLMKGIRERVRAIRDGDGPVTMASVRPQDAEADGAELDAVAEIVRLLGKCDAAGLRAVNGALHDAWNRLERKTAREWKVGDRVYFDGRRGRVEGTIEAILPKNVRVRQDAKQGGFGLPWRVSPSLLKPLDK